jgi:putative oxidoreductase
MNPSLSGDRLPGDGDALAGDPLPGDAPPGYLVLRTGGGVLPLLLRVGVGGVFLFEGGRKFLVPQLHGIGRFDAMGFPFPGFFAPLVGGFEVACALLLLVGLGVRVAAFPLVSILLAAMAVLLLQGPEPVILEAALLGACLVLLRTGGGALSLDRRIWLAAAAAPTEPDSSPPTPNPRPPVPDDTAAEVHPAVDTPAADTLDQGQGSGTTG